jgi:hypothetical protein
VKSGTLQAIAVAAPKRDASLPAVPTFAEAGLADFLSDSWYGIFAGRHAEGDHRQAERRDPARPRSARRPAKAGEGGRGADGQHARAVVETLRQQFMEPSPTTPEDFTRFMAEQLQKWKPVHRAEQHSRGLNNQVACARIAHLEAKCQTLM